MLKKVFLLLALFSFTFALNFTIVFYYGDGCPHCARMEPLVKESINSTFSSYNINLVEKEVYKNAYNRQEMLNLFVKFGVDPSEGGVPTTLVDGRSIIIGEVDKKRFEEIVFAHIQNKSLNGVFTQKSFSPIKTLNPEVTLTIPVLIGAAVIDSINPCTIAIMVMLLSVVLAEQGRKKMLISAAVFISTIFVCYLAFGLGLHSLLASLANPVITNAFYIIMTIAAFILALMEINAYFNYSPGFTSVEIPMFLRPYVKEVISKATSLPAIAVAAFFCSFFLLPCSSGPYLMVLSMLAKAVTLNALLYLIIYNIVFVLPMVIIAGAILIGKTTVERVGAAREKYIRELHLFSGLLLLVLFFIMLSQVIGIHL
ncbi:MAG: hypothetical protein QXS88_04190 [Candidatus Bilamarchaeaceae archaeon]